MDTLHIVVVNDFGYVNGGASQVALTSARALARRGFRVTLFCAVGPVIPEVTAAGADTICCDHQEISRDSNRIRAACQGIWNRAAATKFSEFLDSLDPLQTVIHLHSWTKALSSSIVPIALGKRFRLVLTVHDYFLACPNGGFFNYRKNEICRLQPLSLICLASNCDRRRFSHKLWRSTRQIIQERWGQIPCGIRHLITVSDFSRSILEPFLVAEPTTYHVANPILVEKSEPARVEDQKSYTAVGRIDRHKGALLFARAAKNTRTSIIFAGEGECQDEVLAICPSVEVTGWLSHDDVIRKLRRSRALVFPSFWYETQGLVVLEAAALGVPAIVPDTSAAREMVTDGKTGLWFRGGDVNDLADKMRILQDGQRAKQMGQAAYDRYWADPFTVERHADGLEEVYRGMLGLTS